ncbi:5-nitroimidazole antibiotic resistance protein [Boeremia exigua]|uniref:5-nitroimidazole antibiotic resistance protein n=1 Tax=Boeremia exigua TaxID=749465 RepID=UPI001E8DB001|nr:5-nitroimidazole antibiotic resistance protein [Boeremia exigua]KAH6633180.1 5-nitroimidazole antibiotic resistance protein [Boeremia exigua]
MASPEYPKTATNKLGRLANRGTYDFATIHTLINTCPVLHVSFNDPEHPFPVVLPMLGCTGAFASQSADPNTTAQDLYIHGYVSGRLFKQSKNADAGLPVTVAATFLDGLVLALAPFHNSCNYRSAVAYGYAELVTDEAEALYAMQRITDNIIPDRWAKSRGPPTKAELTSTSILRVRIESASAKVRVGGPSEDRADLKDAGLVKKTWTGVVPYWGTWGEPVEGKENGCAEVEGYIEEWRMKETSKARNYAFEAIEK